jgi:hypothetical protein
MEPDRLQSFVEDVGLVVRADSTTSTRSRRGLPIGCPL